MSHPPILAFASIVALSPCAQSAAAPPQAALLAAPPLSEPAGTVVVAAPGRQITDAKPATTRSRPVRHALRAASLRRVDAANDGAVREPDPGNFLGAVQVYPWSDGALYRLYASPGEVSDLALQPGETLVSVAAGDTVRWIIGDTTSGSGATRRTHILVKPFAAGLTTNLIIATDRRVYHLDARSNARTAMASLSWIYPEDALVALRGAPTPAPEPVAADLSIERLNFDYRIEGDNAPWRPVRAFDDGRQVFIQFPPSLAQGEAPPLFVTGPNGRVELVNYRVRGLYYVVDRLFDAAELRMGEKHQQVVHILRGADARRGGRGQ